MKTTILALCIFAGCIHAPIEDRLIAIQIQDRNGLVETIHTPEKLETYQSLDYFASHPYKKVLRMYRHKGRNSGKITTYHPNGTIAQYLEIEEMRAHGTYREWHPNGQLKVDAFVLSGTADVSPGVQNDWLFDGVCQVWNEEGKLIATIPYDKGIIEGRALHYYPDGQIEKELFYTKNLLHGSCLAYFPNGMLQEKTLYRRGAKHGLSLGYFPSQVPAWIEEYADNLLLKGVYYSVQGDLLSEVENGRGFQVSFEGETPARFIETIRGQAEGIVKMYNANRELLGFYTVKNGMKHGEEVEYFIEEKTPKLSVQWHQDRLHGPVKTWYPNGHLHTQREYCNNNLSGTSTAWYRDGSLMFVEEYEESKLLKGLYYKSHQTEPVSTILNGNGVATLFDEEGMFVRKVTYEHGKPSE